MDGLSLIWVVTEGCHMENEVLGKHIKVEEVPVLPPGLR